MQNIGNIQNLHCVAVGRTKAAATEWRNMGNVLLDTDGRRILLIMVNYILIIRLTLLFTSRVEEKGVTTKIERQHCRLVDREDRYQLISRVRRKPKNGLFPVQIIPRKFEAFGGEK